MKDTITLTETVARLPYNHTTNVKRSNVPTSKLLALFSETGRSVTSELTTHRLATSNGEANNHIAWHGRKSYVDSSSSMLNFVTNHFQLLTLKSWYTNLKQKRQTTRFQQLTAPYEQLVHGRYETDRSASKGAI